MSSYIFLASLRIHSREFLATRCRNHCLTNAAERSNDLAARREKIIDRPPKTNSAHVVRLYNIWGPRHNAKPKDGRFISCWFISAGPACTDYRKYPLLCLPMYTILKSWFVLAGKNVQYFLIGQYVHYVCISYFVFLGGYILKNLHLHLHPHFAFCRLFTCIFWPMKSDFILLVHSQFVIAYPAPVCLMSIASMYHLYLLLQPVVR
jgi:hypothetical protein